MDDAVQPELGGDFELLFENFRLCLFILCDGLFAFRQPMIIQSGFTNRA